MVTITMIFVVLFVCVSASIFQVGAINRHKCPSQDGSRPVFFPDKNCSKYWECSNGTPYQLDCPKGLHFNPKLNICDWPNVKICRNENERKENKFESIESAEESDEKNEIRSIRTGLICPEADCPAVDSHKSVYFSRTNCSQFCQCSNGVAYLFDCPHGLHFNPKLNVCDWPQNVGCGNNQNDQDSIENENDKEKDNDVDENEDNDDDDENEDNDDDDENEEDDDKETHENREKCPQTENKCPAVDSNTSVYFPRSNCSQFCQCSNGDAYLFDCPDGLHFNPALNVCDWPQNARCSGNGNNQNTTEDDNDNSDNNGNENNENDTENNENRERCPQLERKCPAVDSNTSVYFPHSNCSQFCQCSNGEAYLFGCPDGLHFNPILNVCDWPQNAGCGGSGNTENSTEDNNENNNGGNENNDNEEQNNGTREKCLQVENECPAVDSNISVYFPHSNCSQFCQCSNGEAYLFDCPDGLHFNPILNVCDWPQNAGCGSSGNNENSTENNNEDNNDGNENNDNEEQNNGTRQKCLQVENECPAIDSNTSVYFPHSNCSQFCQCSNGEAYLFDCPDGLHFNPILNVCDWPQNAGCGSSENNENSTENNNENNNGGNENNDNEEHNNGTRQKCLQVENECPAIDSNISVYFPHSNCSQFCQCSNGEAYLFDCPEGLHFNPILNVCDWPQNAGCGSGGNNENNTENNNENNNGGNENNDNEEQNNGTRQKCLQVENECPAIDSNTSVYFPHSNCSQFCQCSNGEAYLFDCPDGLHFNPILNICDWPQNAGCGSSGNNENTTENNNENNNGGNENNDNEEQNNGTRQKCLQVENECPTIDSNISVYFPHSNCSQFCQCSNGEAYLFDCPDGLHFNPILNVCDWPQNAGCGSSGNNDNSTENNNENNNGGNENDDNEEQNNGTREKCLQVENECPAIDSNISVYFPHSNCSQFCQCSNGEAYLFDCPEGLHFNPTLNVCDWPQNAGCGSSGNNENSTENNNENNNGGNENNDNEEQNNGTRQKCLQVENECPAIDSNISVYFPHSNCSQFCQCSNGEAYLFDCPDGLHFNPILNVCDWPQNAGCGSSGNNTENNNENNNNDNSENNDKEDQNNESIEKCSQVENKCPPVDSNTSVYFPHSNCSQFCQCSNGLAYLHDCPEGLHFNPSLNVCDWPVHAGCSNGTGSGENEGNTENDVGYEVTENSADENVINEDANKQNPCDEGKEVCPAVDGKDSVYFETSNCSQFCQCSNGQAYLHDCPTGLYFNPKLNVCDWPSNISCGVINP